MTISTQSSMAFTLLLMLACREKECFIKLDLKRRISLLRFGSGTDSLRQHHHHCPLCRFWLLCCISFPCIRFLELKTIGSGAVIILRGIPYPENTFGQLN